MTENEAINYLRQIDPKHIECVELIDMEEVWENIPKAVSVAEKALREIQQYRAIGTVEECREARERQRAKKPVYPYLKSFPTCPNCGEVNLQQENEYGNVVANYDFCPDCGQAILWESDTP